VAPLIVTVLQQQHYQHCTKKSTTPPNFCQGIIYEVLDDPTRNVNHGKESYCDTLDVEACGADPEANFPSPDWKGPGWYRISGDAGTQQYLFLL